MADEPRKKRGADNQLTQDNWDEEGSGGEDQDGEFKKADPQELAKRRIVKARRGGGAPLVPEATDKPVAAAPAAGGAAAPFAWGKAAAGTDSKSEEKKEDAAEAKTSEPANGKGDGSATAPLASSSADKKPLFQFSSFGSTGTGGFTFGSFGSSSTFSFSSAKGSEPSENAGATAGPFAFGTAGTGGFSFGSGTMASFASVGTQGWSKEKKKKGDEEAGEEGGEDGGAGEDAESEVAVKKGDGVVQLEEVETCTGEEDEKCVLQVRAKLFIFGKTNEGAEGEKEAESKPEVGKDGNGQWNVIGIGNLKILVPKEDIADKSKRPRIVMRRQKTFQVCLNTYLFESMACDKAGPKDVRFTGMKSDSETELATYLMRVKEEEQADEFIALVNKHKQNTTG